MVSREGGDDRCGPAMRSGELRGMSWLALSGRAVPSRVGGPEQPSEVIVELPCGPHFAG